MRLRAPGVAVLFLLVAGSVSADTFTLNNSSGQWGNTAIWLQNGLPATRYPGALAGTIDTVSTPVTFYTVTVDVGLTEAVTMTTSCPSNTSTCIIDVTSGILRLTGASTIGSDSRLRISGGGSVVNSGVLTIASAGKLDWSNGSLSGAGSTGIALGGVAAATGPSEAILTGGQILNISGTFTYSGGQMRINSAAKMAVKSGGLFDLQIINGIASNDTTNTRITVESGGTFHKSGGAFGTNIDPPFHNDGSVQVSVGTLTLGRGVHSGAFTMPNTGTGVAFAFPGVHQFTGTSGSLTGAGEAFFGGSVSVPTGAAVTLQNFQCDSFATFSGGGTMNVAGAFSWRGGTFNNVTLNIGANANVTVTAEANATLTTNAHLNNQGSMTVNTGTGALSINSGARVTNDGTMTLAGDVTINSNGVSNARIDNLAGRTISKSAGVAAASVNVILNNSGTVSVGQGLLKLRNGGSHNGTFAITNGSGLAFDGGVHQFLAGSIGGTGTLALSAGTMDVDATFALPASVSFQQSAGILTGAGNFTVNGSFLWTGGSMTNASGNGQTILTGTNSQIASTTSTLTLSGRIISQTGTFTYNPTPGIELSIDDGATFLNTGTFNIVGDAEIDSNQSGTPRLTNGVGGAINKSSGTGSADIYPYFSNNQTLNVTSGSIAVYGGGQDLGTVNFGGAANKFVIANGVFSLPAQPAINGGGAISVDGSFARLALISAVTIPRLEILSGGTVSGGTLGVSSSLLWRNGRMLGGVTNIAVGATVDATTLTGPITLDGHSLTNSGTFTWDGTTHALALTNGSSLINNGTFNATGSGNITGAAPANAITNNGTFKKTGGTSGTRIDPAFSNSGSLSSEVAGHSLIINGGGSQSGGGSMTTSAGALLDFFAGTYTVSAGTSPFNGAGIYRVNGGTLSIAGSMSIAAPATLTVSSGALNVAASSTFQIFGGLTWTGGSLTGDGATRTTGGSIGNSAPTSLLNNHTLSIAGGTFNYLGTSPNVLTISNTAALNVESGSTLAMANGTTIAGTSTDGVTVTGGTLDVSAGSATLGQGSLTGGSIATGSTGVLNLSNGTFVISSGSVTGTGTISVQGSQTLTVNAAQTFPNLQLASGTVNGTGALTVNGGSWSGGTMSGTGSTSLSTGNSFTFAAGTVKTLARNFVNNGTIAANDGFALSGAAVFTNASQFNAGVINVTCPACTGRFHNASGGSLAASGSSTVFDAPFDNDGTAAANNGALLFQRAGTHSGDFTTTALAGIVFQSSHTFTNSSDVSGGGIVTFYGTSVLQGTYTSSGGTIFSGGSSTTFNTLSGVTLGHALFEGDVAGTAALTISSAIASNWNGGTIGGTGGLNIASGSSFTVGAAGTRILDGRTITNNGSLTFNGGIAAGPGGGSIVNLATFRSQPAAAISVGPAFTNHALAELASGSTAFNGGYTQVAGLTKLIGGAVSSPLTVNIDGGSVIGNGTITANVSNDGTFAPGLSPGTITISGNYAQSSVGSISIELAGTTPGTQYDQLVISGAAALDGTLNVSTTGTYTPADNSVFDVVTWGTRSGAFSEVNLPAFASGTLNTSYEPNAFRITADFVGDLAITKSGPATAAFGQNVTFTITVTNNGPSSAEGVTVHDPTPANLTFVANSGDCTTAFPCVLGTLAAGVSKTINATFTVTGGAGSNVTNSANVTSTSTDTVGGNNVDSHTLFVELSDLGITKSGPATAAVGQNVSFTINVSNGGPSAANGVTVNDPTPANLTFVSNSGACTTPFPCSLGSVPSNTTKTIVATYTVDSGSGSNVTNVATVTTTSTDNSTANDTASATVFIHSSDLAISKSGPARAKPGDDISFTVTIANGGASPAANVVVTDPTPAGLTFLGNSGDCTTPFPCSIGTIASGATKTITSRYSISGTLAGSAVTNTASVTTSTADDTTNNTSSATVLIECMNEAPQSLVPSTTGGASGTLSWRGRGDSYIVYFGPAGSGCSTQFATTTSSSVPYTNLVPGNTYEWRVESLIHGCPTRSSACVKFTVPVDCTVPAAPVARVVGQTTSAKTYSVEWDAVPGATHYAIEEALGPDFAGATRITVHGTSQAFKHDVTTLPTAYFYRVFAFTGCIATPGPASPTVRVVIIPLPPKEQPNKSVNVPAGSTEVIVQEVFIPGQPGQNLVFSATTDRPWLSVRPQQGVLTPNGVNLEVFADPKNLPNGTFTASVIVTVTDPSSNVASNGVTTVTTPISVNLVTPITPVSSKSTASQYALIIPTAGHLGGIDSHWQSDIRVTNAGFRSARYKLTFTPSGGTAQGVKETTITVDAGATTALDDVIRNWFGLGSLGDGANGMLEILPLDDPATVSQSTVASSRTYNVSGNGTLGQYIPAVPFPSFIGRSIQGALPQILSLQQIAQNASYRTNVGLAEAAGAPVNAVVTIFDAGGRKLGEVPVNLAAGEQRQMNQLLATQGIELGDGRIEVQVTGGDGKITAYASVVDSATQDPLLVSGQPLTATGANKFILPGVANLDNQLASWRTDMRVFNYGTTSQPATLTFHPFNNGTPASASVLLGAGQIMTLDNVLESQFGIVNAGGVVHLTTPNNASLVVTGRTYNQTDNGTFGQYVPAVTVDQAVAANGRTLHILQVEDSTRYRTNVGLAEVTGKAATVELQVVLPDSKITPTVQIPLAANEFRQFNVIRELGIGNVYNARISVRVIDGDGRVTAYGSVIDEVTQDPTYVPAQ